MMLKEKIYRLFLLKGLSNRGRLKIIAHMFEEHHHLSIEEIHRIGQIDIKQTRIFYASYYELEKKEEQIKKEVAKTKFITYFDSEYPSLLKEIYDPPAVLFYRGNIKLLNTRCISIVGSRKASTYGKEVVRRLTPDLIDANLTLVSGLAKGIDTCVHQGAIEGNGRTIAVLGCGVNCAYPQENNQLQKFLGRKHLLISEYPDDVTPKKWHFPARNRIIAGLSFGVCVIEARRKSGSLITAEFSLETGREVFIVPGSILEKRSEGGHQLSNEGAKCIEDAQGILDDLPNFL